MEKDKICQSKHGTGRQATALDQNALGDDLLFISDTLDSLSAEARVIMEGAKPVDWTETELHQTLHWLAAGLPGLARQLLAQVRLGIA